MSMRPRTTASVYFLRLFLSSSVLLSACCLPGCSGGADAPLQAESGGVAAGAASAGPTPFISLVPFSGAGLQHVVSYRYVVAAKTGALSRPVDVTYSAAALARGGHYSAGSGSATLPVFGLYAGHANQVAIELKYADGSRQQFALTIATAPYVDPRAIFDRPNIIKKRGADSAIDFDYFLMKSGIGGPIVVDTDGDVRWIAPATTDAYSSAFDVDSFIVGSQSSGNLTRIALDGSSSTAALSASPSASTYARFHHNIDRGKAGLLGEVDGVVAGLPSVESVLVEFNRAGAIGKEWDFADILGRYMRSQGDDPSAFIRPGVDWFHVNASTYDPRDDSIIASSRENFVIKVDYSTGNIKWILGDPTKYWYSFPSLRAKALTIEPGGLYPIGQHALSITAGGRLMLFNNGARSFNQPAGMPVGETRPYSAVSFYDIDPAKMTAREAVRFDNDKTILSDICSSGYQTKGGAVLVNYATASSRTKARLVGLDAAHKVAFDFEYPTTLCATSFNAEPIGFEAMTLL